MYYYIINKSIVNCNLHLYPENVVFCRGKVAITYDFKSIPCAKKLMIFSMLISSYFVVYTVMVAKNHHYIYAKRLTPMPPLLYHLFVLCAELLSSASSIENKSFLNQQNTKN